MPHKNKARSSSSQEIEDVLRESNNLSKVNSNDRVSALRDTSSRLNRPLPSSALLQPLPQIDEDDSSLLQENNCSKPTALLGENDSTQQVCFGFQTPSKRKLRPSLLQLAITSSAQKRQQLQSQKEDSPSPEGKDKTPRKQHGQSPKTPRGNSCRSPQTPRTPRTPQGTRLTLLTPKCVPPKAEGNRTPRSRRSLVPLYESSDREKNDEPQTPRTFGRQLRSRIQEVCYDDEDNEDESDSDIEDLKDSDDDEPYVPPEELSRNETLSEADITNDSSCDDESLLQEKTPSKGSKRTSPMPTRSIKRARNKVSRDIEQVASNEDYFLHSDVGASITSDHTLNRLSVPRLTGEALRDLIGDVCKDHAQEREALYHEHTLMFGKWKTLLGFGFSVFLHGVGSKKNLLSNFQEQYLQDEDHIVVNGFFPSLTLRSILSTIIEEVMCVDSPPVSVPDQLEAIKYHYSRPDVHPLYIIFHNIDGPMVRAPPTQRSLSHLCSLPAIRLIATVDHINAPLVLDSDRVAEYNVLWFDATTLAPYLEETSYENSLLVQQSNNLALSSLIHVFKSLTPSTKGIYLLLTNYQLENHKDQSYTGLSFNELYQRCRDKMLVNSELTLRAQLTEFMDHKLLRQKKGNDGTENYIIPLDSSTLKEFLEQQEEE